MKRVERTQHMEDEAMKHARPSNVLISALMAGALVASLPAVSHARDRGVNQPGAAGNAAAGPGGPGRDPGINQPGAAGNVGGPGPAKDPGINQPGAAGNVGKDPGVNQPGAAGNRRR